jgi:RND family efflux transporter MFP subunit
VSARPPSDSRTSELLDQLRIDRDSGPRRARGRRALVAAVLLLALGAAGWLLWGRVAPPAVRIAAARAASGNLPGSVLDASGYVTARRQATVSAKITGKVTEVLIEEGMRVREGAVLARLDDSEARAQLGLARAQLGAARSQDGEIRAQLEQAERDAERQQELFRRELVAAQSLDAALAQRNALRARLAANAEQIRVARESVAVAEVALDNTVIRAPFSGVVVDKAAQPGEMISPISAGGGFTRTGIGTIVDMDSLEIEVDVNEAFINRVTPEQPVEASLNAYPDWKIPGTVIAIVPTADRSKATVKVRIAIKQKDPRIVPDMGARVAFLEPPSAGGDAAARPGVLVPVEAVRGEGAAAAVFVYAGGRLANRYGWTVGQKLPIASEIHAKADGSLHWEFDLVGIIDAEDPAIQGNTDVVLINVAHFDEARRYGKGRTGWYVVRIAEAGQARAIAAGIDGMFMNSPDETKTQPEKEFAIGFARQIGDIGALVTRILVAVFFTILTLTGNTMAQAIRERIPELAVLKTVGFPDGVVTGLVLGEALLLLALGGGLGMAAAVGMMPVLNGATGGRFPPLFVDSGTWLAAAGLTLGLALAVGLPPALRVHRLRIVDALAGHR